MGYTDDDSIKNDIKIRLSALIKEDLPETGEIDMEKDIQQEYGINSVSIISILVAAEREFKISFTDYELDLDEYKTFGDVAAVIKEKIDQKED